MLLLPPDKVDAKNKTMIDAFVDVSERDRSRRSWYWWLAVCLTSLGALWLVRYDFLPNAVRLGLAIAGGIGFLGFLLFLSTKRFGRSDYSGPS